MQKGKEVANVGPAKRGSSLLEDSNCAENHAQPKGKSIGADGRAPLMTHGGSPHVFHFPAAKDASGYRHNTKSGPYRLSGSKSAHMIGSRKK